MSWEDQVEERNRRAARILAKKSAACRDGEKCLSCELYGCVCQGTLKRYLKK